MTGLLLAAEVDYMLYKFAVAVGARGWCWSQLQGSVVEALYYEVVALEFNQVGVEWHAGRGVKTALCMVLNAVWHAASGGSTAKGFLGWLLHVFWSGAPTACGDGRLALAPAHSTRLGFRLTQTLASTPPLPFYQYAGTMCGILCVLVGVVMLPAVVRFMHGVHFLSAANK